MRRGLRVRSVAAACLGALAAAGLLSDRAAAHGSFVEARPAPGVRVEAAPDRVELRFTEPLNRSLARGEIVAADGTAVQLIAQAAEDRMLLLRPARELGTGTYQVRWHSVSTIDGHALEGTFSFGVRAAAAGGAQRIEQSPLARGGWLRVLSRGALYAALTLLGGALLVPLLLARGSRASWLAASSPAVVAGTTASRERRLIENTAWIAVLLALASTLAETYDAAGSLGLAALRDFLTTSSAGWARLALVVALGVVAVARTLRPRIAASALVLALGAVALSGHAAGAAPRVPVVLNDWMHLLSASVWLGGIATLVIVWWPQLRRGPRELRVAVARDVLPGFGRLALVAFGVVVVTGLINLVVQLGSLDALWRTGYGQVLLVKIALVGVIAVSSAVHAFRLRPRILSATAPRGSERRHWALLRSEPVVGVGVVAVVALLVAFPLPPRQLAEADEAVAAQPACDPCPLPAPKDDELAVAVHAGPLLVAGWLRREAGRLTGTVRVYDRAGKSARASVGVGDGAGRGCGPGCWRITAPLGREVAVTVRGAGGEWTVALPAAWRADGAAPARRILERAQTTMRRLESVRQVENVSSGPGQFARTVYRLRAPDRFAFTTGGGVESVVIGDRQWLHTSQSPWQQTQFGSGIPFSLRQWFRWTVFAPHIRLLARRERGGRPVVDLALMDPATPAWIRMSVDERSGRVLRETVISQKHTTTSTYSAYDRPVSIEAPDVG